MAAITVAPLVLFFGTAATLFAAFAIRLAYLTHSRRIPRPGGFEVKLPTAGEPAARAEPKEDGHPHG